MECKNCGSPSMITMRTDLVVKEEVGDNLITSSIRVTVMCEACEADMYFTTDKDVELMFEGYQDYEEGWSRTNEDGETEPFYRDKEELKQRAIGYRKKANVLDEIAESIGVCGDYSPDWLRGQLRAICATSPAYLHMKANNEERFCSAQ